MQKIVTMHQPNYLPWIGLFSKISQADCFIIYDTAQYVTSIVNRNKIRIRDGSCFLTVPVSNQYRLSKIKDVILSENQRWKKDHWLSIDQNYARTPYYKDYRDFFKELYHSDLTHLWQINEKILLFLLDCFEIKVEILKSSEMEVDPNLYKTDSIIACAKSAGANVYLSGPSGRKYLEKEMFQQNNIALKYFNFQHPVYKQRYPGFEPNLAAIDLLFNTGPQAKGIIRLAASMEDYQGKSI